MMLQIIFLLMGLSMASLLLWWIFPMLNLAKVDLVTTDYFDLDDPINAMSIGFGDTMFLVVGLVGFLVSGVLALTMATKGDVAD